MFDAVFVDAWKPAVRKIHRPEALIGIEVRKPKATLKRRFF